MVQNSLLKLESYPQIFEGLPVSEKLHLLCKVPMGWTNLRETFPRLCDPKTTLNPRTELVREEAKWKLGDTIELQVPENSEYRAPGLWGSSTEPLVHKVATIQRCAMVAPQVYNPLLLP